MWSLPRGTRAAARSLQPARTILQPRRHASHEAEAPADFKAKVEAELKARVEGSSANLDAQQRAGPSHAHDHSHESHGHNESALHLKDANASGSESMGSGFYMTLAAVPIFYIGYSLAFGSEDNVFARYYQSYKEGTGESADRDRLHQTVVQQAILDRASLSSYPRETSGPDLNWPEMFNAGSPWNQAVGQGADLRQLEEYYRKVRDQAEEERVARMKSGRSMSAYDPPPLSK